MEARDHGALVVGSGHRWLTGEKRSKVEQGFPVGHWSVTICISHISKAIYDNVLEMASSMQTSQHQYSRVLQ